MGGLVNLGALTTGSSAARGINAFGQIVGQAHFGTSADHAFLYAGEALIDLGVPPGNDLSDGLGINTSGDVLVAAYNSSGIFLRETTFVLTNLTWTPVADIGIPRSINTAGELVGSSGLYSGGVVVALGSFHPTALNESGDMVGAIQTSNALYSQAAMFSRGTVIELGTLPGSSRSVAHGLNNLGQIVGSSDAYLDASVRHAFLYASGVMTDLNAVTAVPSGWTIEDAIAINDSGWIVGVVRNSVSGIVHACLLTPVAATAPSVARSPASQTVTVGSSGTFSIIANGNPPPTYQWQVSMDHGTTWSALTNSAPYAGVTTSVLAISPVAMALDDAQFRAIVANPAGSMVSTSATLSVSTSAVAPTIVAQPANQSAGLSTSTSLLVVAGGTAPLTYQWSRNGAAIPGATHPMLQITNIQSAHAGTYTVTVTNSAGSVASTAATLLVLDVLHPTSLRFAATKAGAAGELVTVTAAQTVTVSIGSALAWTATADQPWVHVTGASGTGPGQFAVGIVNPSNVLGGRTALSATVMLAVPSLGLMVPVPVSLTVQLTTAGATAPIGYLDTPTNGATNVQGSMAVTGWAMDAIGVNRVEIWRNCVEAIDRPLGACVAATPGGLSNAVFLGRGTFVPGARPDLETKYPTLPQAYRAGWGFLLLTNALPHLARGTAQGGQGTFTLSAYALNESSQYTLLGAKTIALDNDHATVPFGTIDTPAPGATIPEASAPYNNPNAYPAFGWAMTQAGKCIDTTSTTAYRVFIDGVQRPLTPGVNWFAGLNRSDLAAAFPGLCNSNNALAAYYINASALGLSAGLHTVSWDVTDTASQTVFGLGTRFFNVITSGADVSSEAGLKPRTTSHASVAKRQVLASCGAGLGACPTSTRTVTAQIGEADASSETVRPDSTGHRFVQLPIGQRLHVDLGGPVEAGYQVVGGESRALPAGSTLDAAGGTFAWEPPIGFFGPFALTFVAGNERIDVTIMIVDPAPAPQPFAMHVDTPLDGATVNGPLSIAGWALDAQATMGSGIDAVHVWAVRRDIPGSGAQFIGAAITALPRPDVAAAYGATFHAAGFQLTTSALTRGSYELTVYVRRQRTGQWDAARTVQVSVR